MPMQFVPCTSPCLHTYLTIRIGFSTFTTAKWNSKQVTEHLAAFCIDIMDNSIDMFRLKCLRFC